MKVVIDTNVFISGWFFAGLPHEILSAWREGKFGLVVSAEILEEYRRVAREFTRNSVDPGLERFLHLIATKSTVVAPKRLPGRVCADPDDDKFISAALSGGARVISSGDKALLSVSGYMGLEILRPREFVEKYLR